MRAPPLTWICLPNFSPCKVRRESYLCTGRSRFYRRKCSNLWNKNIYYYFNTFYVFVVLSPAPNRQLFVIISKLNIHFEPGLSNQTYQARFQYILEEVAAVSGSSLHIPRNKFVNRVGYSTYSPANGRNGWWIVQKWANFAILKQKIDPWLISWPQQPHQHL